jgi:hypothetical protein
MMRVLAVSLGLVAALLIAGSDNASGAELLVNGGFEEGAVGWGINSGDYGQLEIVNFPKHDGQSAARLTGSQLQAHSLSQWVQVQGGQSYRFNGWVLLDDPAVNQIHLEVTWWEAGGSIVGSSSSPAPLTGIDGQYRFLDTGAIVSPQAARSARVAALVRTTGAFTIYLDDFTFDGPPPPTPAPTPEATLTTTPPPTPGATPSPPAVATASPGPTPPGTSAPTPVASPTPEPELVVFPELVNGGFEQLREDGTPYGWRKLGGEMSTTADVRSEGVRALVLKSSTSSTKWVYQTVAVAGGGYYEASGQTAPGSGVDAVFIRISWYAIADGSGLSIHQVDSPAASSEVGFRPISTGAVRAPADARSAKVRLMLRPASDALATAYFDAVSFAQAAAPLAVTGSRAEVRSPSAREQRAFTVVTNPGESEAAALSAVATPILLVNVKPPEAAESPDTRASVAGNREWPIVLATAMPTAMLALAFVYELRRRRRLPAQGE